MVKSICYFTFSYRNVNQVKKKKPQQQSILDVEWKNISIDMSLKSNK
jgi:hypothetical protein